MSFLYPFLNFLQPGVLWPETANLRPMLVVGILALVTGAMKRGTYARHSAFSHPIFLWMCIYLVAQVLSVYYGGIVGMLEEFSFWSVYLLFSTASLLLLSTADDLRRYVWGMIVGGMWLVFYGIYAAIYGIGFGVTGRAGAYGMYENHNDYTFIILQILPFIYLYFRAEQGIFKKFLLLFFMATCVVGVLLSLSRGGILALLLEGLLIVILAMQGRRRWIWVPVLLVVGGVAVAYQWAKRAENSTTYTAADAESSRYELWRAARKMFLDKPLLGVGSRRFAEYSTRYEEISHDELGKNSHNTYLEILAGSGLFGFIPFVLMCHVLIREMRLRAPPSAPPVINATSIAVLVAIITILFRGMLDAKAYDWSFYTLTTIAIACVMLRRSETHGLNSGGPDSKLSIASDAVHPSHS